MVAAGGIKSSRSCLQGQLKVPGDKSITHRALIFSALCDGESEIAGASPAQDCASTIRCLQNLGLQITVGDSADVTTGNLSGDELNNTAAHKNIRIKSAGLQGLRSPQRTLDVGNSGTTMRLLAGLLSGTNINCVIDGDQSIRRRPMGRVFEPLKLMGAEFTCLGEPDCAPFKLQGAKLQHINYVSPIASAQVETAFVLAALQAQTAGRLQHSTITLPGPARDHTVRLLQHIGVPIEINGSNVSINKLEKPIAPYKLTVPGDLSSAAFFMVAAALLPGSDIIVSGVGINPGRRLIIDIMLKMGANLTIENNRNYACEPVADIHVKYSPSLKGVTISGAQVASGIDEIPTLALLGCFCEGTFCVQDAAELRHKESNRLQSIVENLRAAGVAITQQKDGFVIAGAPDSSVHCETGCTGGGNESLGDDVGFSDNAANHDAGRLKGGSKWTTHGDHRLAMTGIIAGLVSKEPITVDDTECIKVSYPSFEKDLTSVLKAP